jgi:HNH endonuclease
VSQFLRTPFAPQYDDYRQYRPLLRQDFRYTCAYCERSESVLGGEEFFEIDHFRPIRRFPEHRDHYPNLYYSCGPCNRHKGSAWPTADQVARGYRFADPCEEDLYVTHVEEVSNGMLRARTGVGDYTCQQIRLNRVSLLEWRREKRQILSNLNVMETITREIGLQLEIALAPAARDELLQKLAGLDATIARLRRRYSS